MSKPGRLRSARSLGGRPRSGLSAVPAQVLVLLRRERLATRRWGDGDAAGAAQRGRTTRPGSEVLDTLGSEEEYQVGEHLVAEGLGLFEDAQCRLDPGRVGVAEFAHLVAPGVEADLSRHVVADIYREVV